MYWIWKEIRANGRGKSRQKKGNEMWLWWLSVSSPSPTIIQVQSPLKSVSFVVSKMLEENKKEAGNCSF